MRNKQNVLLVGPDQEENLSLRYLASSLMAAGHDVVIAPFNTADDHQSVIEAAKKTTLCGLSLCFQVRAGEFLELARALKAQAPERPVIVGGHYASCAAEDLLAHHPELDLVVVHEGERALVELADACAAGNEALWAAVPGIQGLVHREGEMARHTEPRRALEDLDLLPPPLRTGPARLLAGVPTAYMLGSRGCVSNCNYCCITTLHRKVLGKRFRQRAPEKLAAEMARLYHERGVRQFVFHDDNFLVPAMDKNHRRLDALQGALDAHGVEEIAFTIKCRPQEVEEHIFSRLREMGLIRVFLGIESASEAGLSCLGRQHSQAEAAAALALCRALGISAQYTMMIFHPAATIESCRTDLAFMEQNIEHPLNFCRTEIYAGTPLEQLMLAEGRTRGDYLGRSYTIPEPRVQWVSDLSARLFLDRCWQTGSLLERTIGLDHLSAVMRRMYDDPRVDELSSRILSWRTEVNRDTLSLLSELFDLGAQVGASGATERSLRLALARLKQKEQATRDDLYRQGLELFDEINQLTLSLVGLELEDRSVVAARSQTLGRRLARHAAAALLAVGVASWTACDDNTGVSEYAPPPVDGRVDAGAADGAADVHVEFGQSEYAPPPVDGRVEIGHAEYAPPPVDGGKVKIEAGHAEYAPPPVDGGKKKGKD